MYTNKLILACDNNPITTLNTLHSLLKKQPALLFADCYLLASQNAINHFKRVVQRQDKLWRKFCESPIIDSASIKTIACIIERAQAVQLPSKATYQDYDECRQSISTLVFWLTQSQETALYILLSNTQPEVSYFLSYHLSMYGREQDHLFEAAINDAEENSLVTIPFILQKPKTVSMVFDDAPVRIKEKQSLLVINLAEKQVTINGIYIDLSPTLFAWYSWLAARRKYKFNQQDKVCIGDHSHKAFLNHFKKVYGSSNHFYMRVEEGIHTDKGFTTFYLSEKRTRINNEIKKAMHADSYDYLIKSHRQPRAPTQYGLALAPECIVIIETL